MCAGLGCFPRLLRADVVHGLEHVSSRAVVSQEFANHRRFGSGDVEEQVTTRVCIYMQACFRFFPGQRAGVRVPPHVSIATRFSFEQILFGGRPESPNAAPDHLVAWQEL